MHLTITFPLVRCSCGAERQAGQHCPACDCEPEEIDEDLERRRAIVGRCVERDEITDAKPLAVEDAFPAVGGWLDDFSAAYETINDGSIADAAARLRDSLLALDVLHLRAAGTPRLRPNHALWTALDAVLASYDDVRDTYLEALTAPTPDEAEQASARGQAAIDAAAAALERFNDLTDAWQRVHEADLAEEHSDVLAGAEGVVDLTGTTDMVELDRQGAELFARITGGGVACPSGLGLALHLLALAVEGSMDPPRFWATSRSVYELLAPHEAALRGLFSDANWRADLAAASLEVRDAGFEAAAVAAVTGNRRRLVQSALRLSARQIERAAPTLLATLLALESRQPYASKRRRDIGTLLTQTARAGHENLLLGLDPKLRDADAHGEFTLDDSGVRLTGSRGKLDYLTDDELIDVTLAGGESIAALHWGVIAALVAAGVDVERLEEIAAAEVADEDKIKFVLLLNGWHDVEVTIDGADIVVRGRRDGPNAWGLIGAVVAIAPVALETLTLIPTDEMGVHTARGPLAPYRRWSGSGDELEKEIAFTFASMAWTIDGEPIMTRAHAEKIYAFRVMEALNPEVPPREALRTLRAYLEAAREIGSDDLATALAAALRLRREVAMGTSLTAGAEEVVEALNRWLLVDLPEIPSSW